MKDFVSIFPGRDIITILITPRSLLRLRLLDLPSEIAFSHFKGTPFKYRVGPIFIY